MNLKLISLSIGALFFVFAAYSQTEWRNVYYSEDALNYGSDTSSRLHFMFQIKEGKLTGAIKAYYQNGNLKASGNLENGRPKGEWQVYDSDGTLALKRYYHHITEYEPLYPVLTQKGPAELFGKYTPKPLERDTNELIVYKTILEMDVFWKKRLFRWVPNNSDNRTLFENDLIWKTLWPEILASKIRVFDPHDPDFKRRMSKDEIQSIDIAPLKLMGMEIKEIFFFDKRQLSMEVRILGIRPVFVHATSQDTVRLFWLYYPDTRATLAAVKMVDKSLLPQIKHLDDALHFRHFSSSIYATVNLTASDPEYRHEKSLLSISEAEKIEMDIIETDFSAWAYFNSKMLKKK